MLLPKADSQTDPLLFWQDPSLAPRRGDFGLIAWELLSLKDCSRP